MPQHSQTARVFCWNWKGNATARWAF